MASRLSIVLRRAALVFLLLPAAGDARAAQAENGPAADECIVEFTLPPESRVTAGGKDYGARRRLAYRPLRAGSVYPIDIVLEHADGSREPYRLLLEAGRVVRVSGRPGKFDRPEMLVQSGHLGSPDLFAFSGDQRYLATASGSDRRVILWQVESGRKLREFSGMTDYLRSVAMSPDGRFVAAATGGDPVLVWNAVSGERLHAFTVRNASHVAFTANSRYLVVRAWNTVSYFSLETGAAAGTFESPSGLRPGNDTLSRDGRWMVLGARDDRSHSLIDTARRTTLQTFRGHTKPVYCMAVTADGSKLATSGGTRGDDRVVGPPEVFVWDVASGRREHALRATADSGIKHMQFSADGARLAVCSDDRSTAVFDTRTGERVRLIVGDKRHDAAWFDPHRAETLILADYEKLTWWDLTTGNKLRDLTLSDYAISPVEQITFDPAGERWLMRRGNNSVIVWSKAAGGEQGRFLSYTPPRFVAEGAAILGNDLQFIRRFEAETLAGEETRIPLPDARHTATALSPDGRFAGFGDRNGNVEIWNAAGEKLHAAQGHAEQVLAAAFSSDGARLATSSGAKDVCLWEVETGRLVHRLAVDERCGWLAFSPNGRLLLLPHGGNVELWDVASGRMQHEFDLSGREAVFNPAGDRVVTFGLGERAQIWDVAGGRKLFDLPHTHRVRCATFRGDGRLLATGGDDQRVKVWNTADGRLLREFQGHTNRVLALAFTPAGGMLASGSADGTFRFWDVHAGIEAARLIHLDRDVSGGEDWLIVTPEGLFDGSAWARSRVMYRVGGGLTVAPVDRFFQDFYRPGLLLEVLGGAKPLPEVQLGGAAPPEIRIVAPGGGAIDQFEAVIEVEVKDSGGGVRGPWLLHNGARRLVRTQPERVGDVLRQRIPVTLMEGENTFEIRAASEDGAWESEPAALTLVYQRPLPKPRMFLVAVGVGDYGEALPALKLATGDARTVAELFRDRGTALYEEVEASVLIDAEASRAGILAAVEQAAAKTRPQDTLAVYLAGHGLMAGEEFLFLPHDARPAADSPHAEARSAGLSSAELGEAVSQASALKRLIVFDTGQSGGPLASSRTARNPFALRGSIERLSRAQGVFTIASTATASEAGEVPELQHGVLTYALLAGLGDVAEGPLAGRGIRTGGSDSTVQVLQWFGYASRHVPQLTRRYFGQASDLQHSSLGANFPVLPAIRSSRPLETGEEPAVALTITPLAAEEELTPAPAPGGESDRPAVHVISIGVSRYAEEARNLRFAAADARAISALFRVRGAERFGRVQGTELLDEKATRRGVLETITAAASRAEADDVLVVFLAGHGATIGQRYYFLPHDFRQGETLEEDIRTQGVAADEIAEALARSPAKKRLLLFDTCASGGALGRAGRGTAGLAGVIGKLAENEGTFAIAAAAAGEEAQEIPELGHGALTYSLLAGLGAAPEGPLDAERIAPQNEAGVVDVLEWFSYASQQVPKLTGKYLGREQEVQTSGQGSSFLVLPARGEKILASAAGPGSAACVLELDLPEEAHVWIEGRDFGRGRRFAIGNLPPGAIRGLSLEVVLAEERSEHALFVEAGRTVRFSLPEAAVAGPKLVVAREPHTIIDAHWTSEGDRLLTIGMLGVTEWDTAGGKVLRQFNNSIARGAAISPDGTRLYFATSGVAFPTEEGQDGEIEVWDVTAGRKLRTLTVKEAQVQSLAVSHDGRRLLAAEFPGSKVMVLDTETGQVLHTLWGHSSMVRAVAWSPDGALLATASGDNTAMLWDAASGEQSHVLRGHEGGVDCLAFSGDGHRLLTGSSNKSAILWDTATGRSVRAFAANQPVKRVALNPAASLVVIEESGVGTEPVTTIRNAANGEQVAEIPGNPAHFGALSFDKDGSRLLAVVGKTSRGELPQGVPAAFDAKTGRELAVYSGGAAMPMQAVYSSSGREFLTATIDGNIWLWNLSAGNLARRLRVEGVSNISLLKFAAKDRYVAAGGLVAGQNGCALSLFEASTGRRVQRFEWLDGGVVSMAVHPEGAVVAASSPREGTGVFEVATKRELHRFPKSSLWANHLAYSSNGAVLVTATQDFQTRESFVLAYDTRRYEAQSRVRRAEAILRMEVNPTGEQALLILGEWGAAREWRAVLVDLKEGRELHALGEAGLVGGAAFSADGKRLLIGRGNVTSGLECVVYDTTTGRELGRLPGAGGGVALHPGGRLVAASRMEGSLTLFDLATRRSVASLYGVGEGDWIVTSAGSYDASQPNSPWLMTEISPEAATAASESLLEERRRPNLLSEVLAPLLD